MAVISSGITYQDPVSVFIISLLFFMSLVYCGNAPILVKSQLVIPSLNESIAITVLPSFSSSNFKNSQFFELSIKKISTDKHIYYTILSIKVK